MKSSSIVAGVDIGSTKVAFVVGQISEGLVEIISVASAPNSGLRRGIIVDIEESVSSISSALEQAEKQANISIDKAIVGVAGTHIITTSSKGIIAVSRPNGQIFPEDVSRAIEAARAVALPPNQEILHVIPKEFVVDGQAGVKDPVGMTGIRLETEVMIIGCSVSVLKNLEKCTHQAGLEVGNLVFNGLATSTALLNKKQKEVGVVLVDIGGATTTVTVWEEGDLIYATVIPMGSNYVTNDIAIGLKTALEVAEQVKIKYGHCLKQELPKGQIDLKKIDPRENQKVDRELVVEIIEARMKEILDKVQQELKAIGKDAMLPAGAVLTGGGSQIKGCAELAKEELHLPSQVGYPVLEVSGNTDRLDQPEFITALGLMLEGLEETTEKRLTLPSLSFDTKGLSSLGQKAKDFFKQLLP